MTLQPNNTAHTGHAAPRAAAQVSSDPLRDYLQGIGRAALLTAEQEVDLARRIEAGVLAAERLAQRPGLSPKLKRELAWLSRDGERAFEDFVCANLRLVVSIAKRYAGRGLPMMDVIQEGNLGLVRAVEKFDYTIGNKFSTYATWWIRQSIQRGIADSSRIIRIPVHTVEKIEKLNRLRRDLGAVIGRTPTVEELADSAQLTEAEVVKLEATEHDIVSLGLPIGDDGATELGDLIEDTDTPTPFDAVERDLRSNDIRRRLDALPARDATVLRLRFGLEGRPALTLDEVGEIYGITRERVRQLEIRSLKRLRSADLHSYLG
ncbi:sigma-70 family RNA polymerase sigma factor [Lacisediminihabitans profunda]|uniref:RNA polymerase sigma factor n=1 Tax=Lacisediminihabitans profunda TaxID=2594790 RepID=A0A5C8UNK1_9MICO|nr:sigma-70 family RNA polymerase sigma factor [Lacisediminihabitans profunda]TXN29009.1 sigma-70 family RNA polymerase sigma factor [Lacisediminihabitans profunda]